MTVPIGGVVRVGSGNDELSTLLHWLPECPEQMLPIVRAGKLPSDDCIIATNKNWVYCADQSFYLGGMYIP